MEISINEGEVIVDGAAHGWYVEQDGSTVVIRDDLDRKVTYGSPEAVAEWITTKHLKISGEYNKPMEIEELNTPSPANHGKKWTEEEQKTVLANLECGNTFAQIADLLGRSENAIRVKVIDGVLARGMSTQEGSDFAHKYGVSIEECAAEAKRREERSQYLEEKRKQRAAAKQLVKSMEIAKPKNEKPRRPPAAKKERQDNSAKVAAIQAKIKTLKLELSVLSRDVAALK